MTTHALLSASKAVQWINCPGSIALGKDIPDSYSIFAEEGTAAHELASWCLEQDKYPIDYLGEMIRIVNGKYMSPSDMIGFKDEIKTDNLYEVTLDMAEHIENYIQAVKDFTPKGAERLIEQRVDFSSYIGVENSFGTSDVIIIHKDEICIIDLKYGMGVEVSAFENPQLMLYALGALKLFDLTHDIRKIRMVIHQPRINNLSEWDCSVEELLAFAEEARLAAQRAVGKPHDVIYLPEGKNVRDVAAHLNPGESQCRWCKAKAICPALAKQNLEGIAGHFVDLDSEEDVMDSIDNANLKLKSTPLDRLSNFMKAADLVELWIKGVREAVMAHLARGEPIDGFKLVRGKQGNRRWDDEKQVEKDLKKFKLKPDQMYNRKLISPTDAEKLLGKLAPDKWDELQPHIKRSDGSLSVAPESDKREAVSVDGIEFDDLTTGEE